jgi:hypothetical protein
MKNLLLLFSLILISMSGCRQDQKTELEETKDSVQFVFNENDYLIPDSLDLVTKPNRFGRAAVVDISKKVARVMYVVEYDLYLQLGSDLQRCSTFVIDNHNKAMKPFAAGTIYTKITKIVINTVPTVYTPITNSAQMLVSFTNNTVNEPNIDVKGLLVAKIFGGIAWIGGINSSTSNCFVAGLYPYSNDYNPYNTSHEIGHVYGSIHTHDCWRFLNGWRRLDSCATGCGQTNTKFTYNGTVMSYCNNRGTIKMPLEFHPLCMDTMKKLLAKNSSIPTEGSPEPPTITRTIEYSGTTHSGIPNNSTDGNLTTRYLTTGPFRVQFTYSAPVTITNVFLNSGFQGGSPNQTLTLKVDGVNVLLNFTPMINFSRAINVTGKVFELTTTGTGNISRVFEIGVK